MSLFELVDKSGDTGMLVVGLGVDQTFRKEADSAERPDERLIDTTIEAALDPRALRIAAAGGYLAAVGAHVEVDTV